ncbi:hypothetical protein [Brevundimonas sp.]|uniref:hypothetical protein n=1 Tax=Brevundimonas sp. TaxID=1871086 RepID=UPI00286ADE98|nr:hypothetical protein [Brevundimonas sp.]
MQEAFEKAFHVDGSTTFDQSFWNRFVLELAARLRGFENIKIAWAEVSRQGIDVALARINEAIGPAAERIRRLTELGFLVAASETPATLEAGALLELEVAAGDARDLFAPSPFLLLGRTLSADDYAVVKLRSYDPETGLLSLEVITVAGDPGPHSDWSIGALAGSTLAQLLMLEEGRTLAATILAAVASAEGAASDALGHKEFAEAAIQIVQEARDATIAAATPLTAARVLAALAGQRKAAAYTAAHGEVIRADTSAGPWTFTLPLDPADDVQVSVIDPDGSWPAKNLTINPNGKVIRGCTGNLVLDISGRFNFIFDSVEDRWTATYEKGAT